MAYRLGVDIGGTFTDFALVDDETGAVRIHKQLTTPHDPAEAVLDGLSRLLAASGVGVGDVNSVIHGSTLVTNAVIERRGAPTGMLVTRGFSDVLDIALERRYDLYNLRLRFPKPLVARACRVELDERMRFDGSVIRPVNVEEAGDAAARLIETHGVRSIAICLVHSCANPAHERAVAAHLRERFPDIHLSASSEVARVNGEYQRWTTTTMNAYAQPLVDRYLESLVSGLAATGFQGSFFIVTSSGGMMTPSTARRFPVRTLESGPAAGALMSARHGRVLGLPDLLSFDMGGTTAKGAVISGAAPRRVYEFEAAREHEFKPGSGLPVRIPVIDMIEIGAGGGSIAGVDERGVIRVGPVSAGADPGPACYGKGGRDATLTDANVALGYLDPDFFLGGAMTLDRAAAVRAIGESVGEKLGLDAERAAWGIHEIINEDVGRAFRMHASERGFDYRRCSMIAFGGSGPLHALRVARKLRIPRVVFPIAAGVMSALGMLAAPVSFSVVRSRTALAADLDGADFAAWFEEVEEEAAASLVASGVSPGAIRISRSLDVRYQGQGHEIEITAPRTGDPAADLAAVPKLFLKRYAALFGPSYLAAPVEIVNWKVDAEGPEPPLPDRLTLDRAKAARSSLKGRRRAFFPELGGFIECPVHDRYALATGARLDGPALIEEREATILIGPDDSVEIDAAGNAVAELRLAVEGSPS